MPYLLLMLLAYPIAEIIAMVLVVQAIGLGWLLVWLATAAVLGSLMLRHHKLAVGLSLLADARARRLTSQNLFWVARYYIAALLLLLPGIIGDVVAVLMLLPWRGGQFTKAPDDKTLEGEYRRVDPHTDRSRHVERRD